MAEQKNQNSQKNQKNTKVVILCGGMGTRLREQTEFMPKPLVEIGGMPILWHIMKTYSHYGFKDFILCLGYKGDMLKEYFVNFEWKANDFTLNLKSKKEKIIHSNNTDDWNITFVNTGLETNTGGRIKKIEKYIDGDMFLVTYGDGVADIDINKLMAYHNSLKPTATLSAIHPISRFGVIEVDNKGFAKSFKEKPQLDGVINGGFFVFNRKIFDYLDENCVLEQDPLMALAKENKLAVYEHKGFWYCMDTFKDMEYLNGLWKKGNVPWKVWK
ncbi:glucose-1-phosphate cytidylyltransferase [Candidatus Woesearchaeota archaeon CG10_big_fil_rev_8_21_14_0_10_44_13]|nr:MAG: glucose-1-phosphate cytidylyltransferase [Candidatus Woesearchaeota archaeon CG10_big_fil_rev_8_21_14_0_10_44_13]